MEQLNNLLSLQERKNEGIYFYINILIKIYELDLCFWK